MQQLNNGAEAQEGLLSQSAGTNGNASMFRFLGQRKNLRGVKRRVGDVWQLPKGFVCYTPTGWVKMEVNKVIECDAAIMIKDKEETL